MNPEQISYVMVEERSHLERIAVELKKETAIGVDLEADSMFHYFEKVCLLQVSTPSQNLLIDPLALKDLSPLIPVFSDSGIQKIFHGADYDIRSLHRDFGIEVSPLFDTQIAAAFLGIKEMSLAGLVKERFGVTVEKKYQKKDWSERPLPQPMLEYAAKDACYLLPLANMLKAELRGKERLFCVEEECERLSKVRATQGDCSNFFLKFKGAGMLDPRSLTILETILQFRDDIAKKQNRPPFKVIGNAQIKKMVKEKPANLKELKAKECLSPKQVKELGYAISRRIDEVLNLPEDSLLVYPKKKGIRFGPKVGKRVKALKKWRKDLADETGIDLALICSNNQIWALAASNPKTPKDLERLREIRTWQRELFGQEICSILNSQ